MKECDKRKSHTSSRLSVAKTSTTLHPTTLHSTSLQLSTLHLLPFKLPSHLVLPSFKFPTTPFHLTSLHFASYHYTLLDHFRHTSIPFISFNSGSQWKAPKASARSWFQFSMVLFKKEYFPISILCFLSLISRP
jgi:hypothetical protein